MGHTLDLAFQTNSREIRKAWELFVSGDDSYLEKVRPEIRESWLRSRQAGVTPALRRLPNILGPEELERRCRQNAHLLEAGRMAIALLFFQRFSARAFMANIADGEGNLLYSYSSFRRHDKREDINAFPGAGFPESLVGTTSPGLALHLNRPAQVQWYEYYAELGHDWVGCAAPIHNSYGDILGTLSIAIYGETAHPHALDLIVSAAEFVEKHIKRLEELTHLEVLKKFNHHLLKFPDSLLVALCLHGRILALSQAMAKLVTSQPPDRLIGQSLRDIQDFKFADSFPLPASTISEPYESAIVFPQKQKICSGTVVPVQSKEGERAGLVVVVSRLSESARNRATKPLWQATHTFQDLVGRSATFRHALQCAQKAAEHDGRSVLLVGESGTGKELFAQAIHRASCRAPGPFVALNCSMIPKELLASELFGYEEGAFSGALRGGKRGKIELAHWGTLFLDELGDMPAEIQLGFLRFLEEGKIVPLGSEHPRAVDVRVIAAMNLDPSVAIAQGKLRLDLYHRLNQLPIFLPPLRERLEDLPLLVHHLLESGGFSDTEVSPEAMEVFCHYPWLGNVRELQNILMRAVIFSSHKIITRDDLPPEILNHKPSVFLQRAASRHVDREQIRQALQECRGNISRAAQHLGIHRVTLHKKLHEYELARESFARKAQ